MKKTFLTLLCGIMLFSCSDDDDNLTTNSYGLRIGNSWNYQFNDLRGTWNENTQAVTITGVQNMNGQDYFIKEIETTFNDGSPNLMVNDLVRGDAQGYLVDSFGAILAHPIDFSFTGSSLPIFIGGMEFEYRTFLDSNNLTVIVPAGSFANRFNIGLVSYHVQSQQQQGSGQAEFIYVPDIGLVKENQTFLAEGGFIYEKVLVS